MHRIARALGFTHRKSADLKTALEVTAAFRKYSPEDPAKYDFALTRLGIRKDVNLAAFLETQVYGDHGKKYMRTRILQPAQPVHRRTMR
jgi:hypothetical protein